MILCRGTHHGGAANVDILYDFVPVGAPRDGLRKGIEIDNNQVDSTDVMLLPCCRMIGIATHCPQTSMPRWMPGLYLPVTNFRKARQVGNVLPFHTSPAQGLAIPSGTYQFAHITDQ